MSLISGRQSQFLSLIRLHGALSRRDLIERTGLRPNTVGEVAGAMLADGLLRERDPENTGPGRPRQPLEIDPGRRRVVGLALDAGRASVCRLDLTGRPVGPAKERTADDPDKLVTAAAELVAEARSSQTIAIGVSVTGFVDPVTRSILTSSATRRQSPTRIAAVYDAAGEQPVLLENDMHARAAHWLLTQEANSGSAPSDDVLLIDLRDGAVGAAVLVDGRPNRGCVIGGNELGHTRFFVDTDRCYCGQVGCLERICSTAFLKRSGGNGSTLEERVAYFDPSDAALENVTSHLAMGIANAINFIRPTRVVLTGALVQPLPYRNHLVGRVRSLLLSPLADRVRLEPWEKAPVGPSEAAGWLALAAIYRSGWSNPGTPVRENALPTPERRKTKRKATV